MKKHTFGLLKIGCLLVLGLVPSVVARGMSADDAKLFDAANEAYRASNYGEAAKLYEDLIGRNKSEPALYYNLANSLFREGNRGLSILNYERALVIEPRHEDSRHNLQYVRSLLEYRIDDKRNWYIRAGEAFLGYFSEREIFSLALVTYLLVVASWTFCLLRRKAVFNWWTKSFLVALFLAGGLLVGKGVETRLIRDAIVIAGNADIRYGPSESDQTAFRLGEGIKVYVVDKRSDWSRIILVDGQGGWVKNRQISQVIA